MTQEIIQTPNKIGSGGKFYALLLPQGCEPFETLVFTDLKEVLLASKKNKGSRFKEFDNEVDAITFTQSSISVLDVSAILVNETEKSSVAAFKSLAPRDLAPFRRMIEAGKEEEVTKLIWSNPRYLISSGDTAVILMEGPRYNASHCAAKSDRGEVLRVILDTVKDLQFIRSLYVADGEETTKERSRILLDCYLNTPDKGACETPLHFASKFGAYSAVKVLLSFRECHTHQVNKFDQRADEVICERKHQGDRELKERIRLLFQSRLFIPVIRTDDSVSVGKPTETVEDENMEAVAGPMSPPQAQMMFQMLKSPNRKTPNYEARLSDPKKGIERMARVACREMGVDWIEWWPFLNTKIDLISLKGLKLMEKHLKEVAEKQHAFDVDDLCSRLLNIDFGGESSIGNGDEGEEVYVTAPSSPIKPHVFVDGPQMSEWDKNAFLALDGHEVEETRFPFVFQWMKDVRKGLQQRHQNGFLTPMKPAKSRLFFSP